MYLGQWQWRVSSPDKREGEGRLPWVYWEAEEKEDRNNWVGRVTEKDPGKCMKANNLTGWSRGTWVQCLLSCIHVHPRASPAEKEKVLLLPSFLLTHALSRSSHPFPVFNYTDYLNSVSLVYLPNQMHFLSLCWIFPHQCPINILGQTLFSFTHFCYRGAGKTKYSSS